MSDPSVVPAKDLPMPIPAKDPPAPDPLIGRIIDGRYRIHSLLAVGGMGRVYKAEQSGLGRTVAIKVLSVNPNRQVSDPQFRERFALEAATASRLTSPNTITIFHHGRTDDDIYYIVMEYVEGVTLGRLVKREGRLSVARAINIMSQVCLSLREAHARGIVHRDIKPSNIMLINGDYDQVKVLDFGIAKQMVREADEPDQELTSSRSYVGTPEYMAPEYFDGRVEPRSDIYSLGVVLYLAVTGRLPFKGKTATQTILMAMHDPVPAIDPMLGVPLRLEDLILACLERDPECRPPSVADVLHALQLCLVEADDALYGIAREEPAADAVAKPKPAAEIVEDPITATNPFVVPPTAAAPKMQTQRLRVVRTLLLGVALLAIGGAAGLLVRHATRNTAAAPAAVAPVGAPAAPAPGAAEPVTAPAVAPAVVPPAATGQDAGAPAAEPAVAAPAKARATDEAAPAAAPKRGKRSGARARPEKPARASSAAKHDRDPPPDRRPAMEKPVPDGYKPSPY
jgi:predicted Ser/Thr protein kinase